MTQFFSQYAEDRILSNIFKHPGICVEVGAHDGIQHSNSYYFERVGWRCILVEPHPLSCQKIRARRSSALFECAASDEPGSVTLHLTDEVPELSTLQNNKAHFKRINREGGTVYEVSVPARTLDDILTDSLIPTLDFITIDVEGHELQVLRGFNIEKWRPRILIIEDLTEGFDTLVPKYLALRSYVPWKMTGCNIWYSHSSDSELVTAHHISQFKRTRTFRRTKHLLPSFISTPLRRVYKLLRRSE